MSGITLEEQLHEKLKGDLITGFLQNQSYITQWKRQFSLYCMDARVIAGEIDGHFNYLEENKLLEIGKYDVLKDIFRWFNVRAVIFIDNASDTITRAQQGNNHGSASSL